MKCDTCHWKMSSGRCQRGQSPNGCSEYMLDPALRRAMEQEAEERKHQEWLRTEAGQKWQAEEKRKKEEERLERERKEREHQEWLASEEGQKWQAKEKQRRKNRKVILIILSILFGSLGVDRFFAGRIGLGIGKFILVALALPLMLLDFLTGIAFLIMMVNQTWWLIDVILAFVGGQKDSHGNYIDGK